MLAEPKEEYPQFPAALSFVLMLAPQEAHNVLERRAGALTARLSRQEKELADQLEAYGLPRVTMLESEYLRAMTAAELDWIRAVVGSTGRLRS